MGDKRVHEQVIALRAVETSDFMTADWYPFDGAFLKRVSGRIVNEVAAVCRVLYNVTSKPRGRLRWSEGGEGERGAGLVSCFGLMNVFLGRTVGQIDV